MPPRPASRPAPPPAVKSEPMAEPRWLRPALIALAALVLLSMFTAEMGDPDTWFHLCSGEYMWHNHKLPVPDPFSWTTYLGKPVYPEEYATRDLNLKHEWLGQVIFYLIFAAGSAPGLILFRAACVSGFCGMVGLIVYHRTQGFYRALAATFAAAMMARAAGIGVDRLYVVTYLLLAFVIWLLDQRRWLWILPPLFAFWANYHGGYFIGWVALGGYCGEALIQRIRRQPVAGERKLWTVGILSILASGLNPTFFGVLPGMLAYRQSVLQQTLAEWHSPALWPLSWYNGLLFAGVAALLWARGKARPCDWLMFLVFGAFSLMAQRNVIFIGLISPIVIASYLPPWKRLFPALAAALALWGAVPAMADGTAFQLRVADWKYPNGAIRFLKEHNVSAPMFNIYEYGGYLMWALWPQEKTFVDGRALNESVFKDYRRIALNMRLADGTTAQDLLDRYGVQVILIEAFEYSRGTPYLLAASLADSSQTKWKLVYQDQAAMLFMRQPPPGVQPLPPEQVLISMDAQCAEHLEHQPNLPRCALGLADLYAKHGDLPKVKHWLEAYLSHMKGGDPEIERMYQQIINRTSGN